MRALLTPELANQLVKTHRTGRDYRKATAAACRVHPATLSAWLQRGMRSDDDEPYSSLAMRFLEVETKLRKEYLDRILSCEDKVQANVLQWYVERRFRDWSGKPIPPGSGDGETLELLEAPQNKGGLTPEQKSEVIGKWLGKPTPWLLKILGAKGWFSRHTLEAMVHEPDEWLTELLESAGWRREIER